MTWTTWTSENWWRCRSQKGESRWERLESRTNTKRAECLPWPKHLLKIRCKLLPRDRQNNLQWHPWKRVTVSYHSGSSQQARIAIMFTSKFNLKVEEMGETTWETWANNCWTRLTICATGCLQIIRSASKIAPLLVQMPGRQTTNFCRDRETSRFSSYKTNSGSSNLMKEFYALQIELIVDLEITYLHLLSLWIRIIIIVKLLVDKVTEGVF